MTCHKRSFKVGKYSLYEKLGAGGFGIVRKAINDEDGSIVAIKILDKTELQLHNMTQHVKKEITLLTMLNHPNIVKGYEVLNSKTKLFLVMEYIDGGDMHAALATRKKFPEAVAQALFRSLIECLFYCHEQGVYHRDLKLENLLLTSDGELKVCDFGLASIRTFNSARNNLCHTIVGTEDFNPPEVLRSVPYNGEKSDMWSAGILLFVMITGYCPFRGRSPRELHQRILSCKFSFPPDFPEQPKRIVGKLLVANETDRLSASELLQYEWLRVNIQKCIFHKVVFPERPPTSPTTPAVTGYMAASPDWNHHGSSGAETPEKGSSDLANATRFILSKRSSIVVAEKSNRAYLDTSERTRQRQSRGGNQSLYLALAETNVPGFTNIYCAMRDVASGISIADRRWRLRSFPACFVGSDAVTWIKTFLRCEREEAIVVGQKLLDAGVFHHVCREHGFEDGFLFYRFLDDEPENSVVLNFRVAIRKGISCPNPVSTSSALLSQLLSVCRKHASLDSHRTVDISGIQTDPSFKAFLLSVCELQVVNIDSIVSDDERVSFLLNIYNLMWIQARIHIGENRKQECSMLTSEARSFQYNIAGSPMTLIEIERILLCSSADVDKDEQFERGLVGSSMFSKLITGKKSSQKIREALKPEKVDPWRYFLMSDSSPQSPLVRITSGKDINVIYMRQAAAEYLAFTLDVNVESCTLTHSYLLELFRKAFAAMHNQRFIDFLANLCTGLPIEPQLRKVLLISAERNIHATILVRPESLTIPQSWRIFAPRMSSPDSMESNESSPWMT